MKLDKSTKGAIPSLYVSINGNNSRVNGREEVKGPGASRLSQQNVEVKDLTGEIMETS